MTQPCNSRDARQHPQNKILSESFTYITWPQTQQLGNSGGKGSVLSDLLVHTSDLNVSCVISVETGKGDWSSKMKVCSVFVFGLSFFLLCHNGENGLSELGISRMKMWFRRKQKVISVPASRDSQDKC